MAAPSSHKFGFTQSYGRSYGGIVPVFIEFTGSDRPSLVVLNLKKSKNFTMVSTYVSPKFAPQNVASMVKLLATPICRHMTTRAVLSLHFLTLNLHSRNEKRSGAWRKENEKDLKPSDSYFIISYFLDKRTFKFKGSWQFNNLSSKIKTLTSFEGFKVKLRECF